MCEFNRKLNAFFHAVIWLLSNIKCMVRFSWCLFSWMQIESNFQKLKTFPLSDKNTQKYATYCITFWMTYVVSIFCNNVNGQFLFKYWFESPFSITRRTWNQSMIVRLFVSRTWDRLEMRNLWFHDHRVIKPGTEVLNEPPHQKTNNMHRRKQRQRSTMQFLHSWSASLF